MTPLHLIDDQVQLLVAVLSADKYFRKSEFGLWIFEIRRSGQKPVEDRKKFRRIKKQIC